MSQVIMSSHKRKLCELDAESIAYYRRNPCIACEDLLGIKLFDAQRYILESTWNASHSVWCCSRNFGKSFIGAVLILLKAILYENQEIYIVSSVGEQAKKTFTKIEEIVTRTGQTFASVRSNKINDIAEKETVKSPTNKTGFSHASEGYSVEFYNGSVIYTLNSKPSNARSRRATLVFFDEAAFCSDELIMICEAFATQSTDFTTSTDDDYNPETEPRQVPTQLVYASSQDEMDKIFYKHYKNFAKRMLAGDRNYFVCDMICDTAISTYMDGKPYKPLLTQAKVDVALATDKPKALREYYNQPTRDGGISQIIKWGTIRRNETFYLPQVAWKPNASIVLALDPARTGDNSILAAMRVYEDKDYGWCGDIINCVNMVDEATKKKLKLDSNRQLEMIRNTILRYNGNAPDYENIDSILIDTGAGGGGLSTYSDGLLNNWFDSYGKEHRGLIDAGSDVYAEIAHRYPDAIDKLRGINPKRERTKMVEELIELMNLGVMRFPYDWSGSDFVEMISMDGKAEKVETYELTDEEKVALTQIGLMKNEITSIHKSTNAEKTAVQYALAIDKRNKMHDDRFYVAILLAHRLYELRRGQVLNRPQSSAGLETFIQFKRPVIRTRR